MTLPQDEHQQSRRIQARRHRLIVELLSSLPAIFLSILLGNMVFLSARAEAAASTRLKTADGSGVVISAESMFRDTEKQIVDLKGGVQIVYQGQYISCDHAVVNLQTQEIQATGRLVISSAQAYVEGDSATLSYKDNTGIIINGFVKSGQVIFEGRVVRKTGPTTYQAERASYTACTTCPTAWTFSGSHITAEIGGYAYIQNSVLRVADFPVLWLPYLIVPLKSERQTGLLIPSIDFSGNGGAALGIPFFWAISRSQDATVTAKNYEKRGFKGLLNYRYSLSKDSEGELNFAALHDRVFESDPVFQNKLIGARANRWFMTYHHAYELPDGYTQRTDLNLVSDLRYPRDFPEEIAGQGDSSLENRVSLTRNTDRSHTSLDVDYYVNQLQENPLAGNDDSVHRWPEIKYGLTERRMADDGFFSGFLFNLKSDYVNFARDAYAYDDVKFTTVNGVPRKQVDPTRKINSTSSLGALGHGGTFDPGVDVIRAGQRAYVEPELSYPFSIGKYLDLLPTFSVRHTQYSFNVNAPDNSSFDPTPYRQLARASLSTRMRMSNVYGDRTVPPTPVQPDFNDWTGDAESRPAQSTLDAALLAKTPPPPRPSLYRHEVIPEVLLESVPYLYQSDSAFFGQASQLPSFLDTQPISDSDFQSSRGVQFDYNDRILNRNTVSFIVDQRLVRKSWLGDEAKYNQIARFRLAQSYDFDEARKENQQKFPWSDVSALADVRLGHFETNTLVQYFPYHNRTNTTSRFLVRDDKNRFAQVSLNQTFLITQKTEEADNGRTQDLGLTLGFDSKYLGFAGSIDYNPKDWPPANFIVNSWSAQINLKPPGNCWGIRALFIQNIGSEETFHFDFDYNFGGA